MPPGSDRDELLRRLRSRAEQLPRYTWIGLVYQAPPVQQAELAKRGLEQFYDADELLAPAGVIPSEEEAFKRYAMRPGLITLMPLTMRLVKNQNFASLDDLLTIAFLTGDKVLLDSADFWLIWGRVADQQGDRFRSSLCFAFALSLDEGGSPAKKVIRGRVMRALAQSSVQQASTRILAPLFHQLAGGGEPSDRMASALSHLRRRTHDAGIKLQRGDLDPTALSHGVLGALLLTRFERDPETRREYLAQAAMQVPESIEAWRQLAVAEDETGRQHEAIGALRNALQLQSNDTESLNNLAYILLGTVENTAEGLKEAEALARRSVMLRATSASLDTVAEIRFRQKDQAAALRFISLARRMDPNSRFLAAQEARIKQGDPKIPVPTVRD